MSNEIIEIDGSMGEAGGQILRTACALSAVTKKPCHIFNIRKGRSKTGLMPQHLLGMQALAKLCNGRLEGEELGSEEIRFFPGQLDKIPFSLNIKIETAGSITLILQTLIPPMLCFPPSNSEKSPLPVKISFEGGATNTFFSPTVEHFQYVFLEILELMGAKIETNVLKHGYYPEGGAQVIVNVYPSRLKKVNLTKRGKLKKILLISGASNFLKDKKVAERQIAGTREVLGKLKLPIEERIEYHQTQSPGSQICLIAEFENTVIGVDNLGKLGKRAEDVGKEAALELLKEEQSHACLDKHLADQILPYLALAKVKSSVTVSEITNHCKTNMWVIEKFIKGRFQIKDNLISWTVV